MQKEAKEKIKKLIEKYKRVKNSGQLKSYTEEETKNGFIKPLFEVLGWDFSDKNEVSAEETISGKRVDHGFYIDGRIKFYLETKKLSSDLHNEDYANQAIRYSWNKGATWAVLTDFESLIVFNAQDIEKKLADKLFFEIPYNKYLESFDRLYLLSKEAIKNDLLDKEAEKYGKKFQKIPVTSLLYKDLQKCRDILTHELGQMNSKINPDLIDEGVQKLLDRLIFIRVAEDREIEDKILIPLVRQARSGGKKIYESMIGTFRRFDRDYNSNLFQPHSFEQWEEYSGTTEKVIDILYGQPGYYEYDFKAMPADVLGAVYESYLGHRLAKSKKGLTVAKDAGKRKEHGIYYTPRFIVDYIVKNALGPVLERCKTISDIKKIKVLDPACGSGSFLIKALEMIADKYKEFGAPDNKLIKIQILEENIYGVDLDPQAVEITRLNLLINILSKREKLPLLDNIKNGNSLISGTDEELKKYFGKNFKDKKPFNWQEQFPEVFKQGGFDVVIGNPPYVDSEEMVKTQPDFRNYSVDFFESARGNWDLFCIFIEKGISLLKENGRLGFIVPNKLISANYAESIRKILEKNKIAAIKDYSKILVFEANVYPIVIVVEKGFPLNNKINITTEDGSNEDFNKKLVPQADLVKYQNGWSPIFSDRTEFKFFDRLILGCPKLSDLFEVRGAATVGEAYEIRKIVKELENRNGSFKFINTGTIDRFRSLWGIETTHYLKGNFKKPVVDKNILESKFPKRYEDAIRPKLIVVGMSKVLESFLDKNGDYLAGKSTTVIFGEKDDLITLSGILNSNLMSKLYSYIYKSLSLSGGYFRIGAPQLKNLPIVMPKTKDGELIDLIKRMMELNYKLSQSQENSNQWNSIKSEIEKTDKKIDQEVYKLYALTPKEIKIVEESN